MKQLALFLLFFSTYTFAQKSDVSRIDSLPTEGVLLDKGWKWHAGDNPDFAKTDFDDTKWEETNVSEPMLKGSKILEAEISWFRKTIDIDSSLINKPLIIDLYITGAAEIYLNGQLIHKLGQVSKDPNLEKTYFPAYNMPYSILFSKPNNVLAIRFSHTRSNLYLPNIESHPPIYFAIKKLDGYTVRILKKTWKHSFEILVLIGIFSILTLLHLSFYYYSPLMKTNLFLGITMLVRTGYFINQFINYLIISVTGVYLHYLLQEVLFLIYYFLLILAIHRYLKKPLTALFWIASTIFLLGFFLSLFVDSDLKILAGCILFVYYVYMTRQDIKKGKKEGILLYYAGILGLFGFMLLTFSRYSRGINIFPTEHLVLLYDIGLWIIYLCIPIALSLTLARDFALTSLSLQKELEENKKLSEEKQQILATQNETLEKQVQERTAELQEKNYDLEVEAALERVRSKTMAMRSSDDVTTAIATLFTELEKLGVNNLRCGIVNIHANKTMGVWSVNNVENLKSVKGAGIFDMNAHIMWQHLYESWAKKEEFFYYFLTDKEKEDYVKVLNAKPNYLPQAVQQFPDMSFQAYCYDEGSIWAFSLQPHSETDKQLMQRFASVFSLTFRRYQDLQNAEAQAEQARLDLILIQKEKKRAEDALSELRITQTQLIQKEKLASLGELTAGIAHEIQNPLNFVNNFSELSVDLVKDLKDEFKKTDKDETYIDELFDDLSQNQEKINHHGKRASSIVKGMLEHSRASTGVRELTDINKLADEYLRLSYHGLRAKDKDFNANFSTKFDENLPKIEVIPQDMGRVLLNLINNAFYAVHQRKQLSNDGSYTPSVFVTTQHIDNQIIIRVKDNGTGMPESVRAKVFQPFFTTKPTGQGTGLGLSLAYDIVTKGHGGTLEVQSTEGVGTAFIIYLKTY